MEKKYTALRIIGTFYKIIGIIIGTITILSMIGLCGVSTLGGALTDALLSGFADNGPRFLGTAGGALGGVIVGIVLLVFGGSLAVTHYALGEAVYLAIAIEENTRSTMLLMQAQQRMALQTREAPPPAV